MKYTTAAFAILALCLIMACTKETGTVSNTPAPQGGTSNDYGMFRRSSARYSGPDYSQSIPVDTANSMIQSYLASINYPTVDTVLRALTMDADTLRAYLRNPQIVTVKFVLAHQQGYKNSNFGKYAGMKPGAVTMIVVGLNEAQQCVRNDRNGVYEHMMPCPNQCPAGAVPTIQ